MNSELKWARSIKRGIAVLFLVGGLLRLLRWNESGQGLEGPFTTLFLWAVGVGLFLHLRWARKAAMGACFLAIVGACVYPFWVLESRPFAEAGEEIQTNILMGVFAATFAWLGYRGLKYFRSELAHSEFSDDATGRAKLAGEGSTSTVVSALGWVLLALFVVAANAPPTHQPADLSHNLHATRTRPGGRVVHGSRAGAADAWLRTPGPGCESG
jgi:hypothetical protein